MDKWRTIFLLYLSAAMAAAQNGTRVDLSKQSNVDFSRATGTKPAQTGTTIPATCAVGEVFFNTAATAGQNLYLCASSNNWTQLTSGSGGGGGGSSPTSTSTLTDLSVSRTAGNPNQLTIASTCSIFTPCNVRFGANTFKVTASATVNLSNGTAVGGMAYIYVSSSGGISVFSTIPLSGGTVTCNGCAVISNVSQFPSDSIPLYTWTASGGQWDALGFVDLRAFLSNRSNIAPGTGIVIADAPGQIVVSADTTAVPIRIGVPGAATSPCLPGNYAMDLSFFYQCVANDTWLRVALATW